MAAVHAIEGAPVYCTPMATGRMVGVRAARPSLSSLGQAVVRAGHGCTVEARLTAFRLPRRADGRIIGDGPEAFVSI